MPSQSPSVKPYSPGVRITSENEGSGVYLAIWISFVLMCLAVLTKIASKLRAQRSISIFRLQADDFFILAVMVSILSELKMCCD